VDNSAEQTKITCTADANLYITLLKVRGKLYEALDALEIVKEDSTSQTAYQKRTLDFDSELMQNVDDARNMADLLCARFADPEAKVTLGVHGNRDAAHLDAVMRLGISDRIDITDTLTGLDDAPFFIEQVHEEIEMSATPHHEATYQLESVLGEGYWILGVSEFDDETIVAF